MFLHKNIFSIFCILLKNVVTVWGQKVQKNIFVQTILENIFFRKKMFLNFWSPTIDYKFRSKTINLGKKNNNILGKNWKNKIFWNFCQKKIFLVYLIIAPLLGKTRNFLSTGAQLLSKFGYNLFLSTNFLKKHERHN